MRISKQLFQESYSFPRSFTNKKTSKLMSNGLFLYCLDKGIPFYLPIGKNLLDKVRSLFTEEAEKREMSQIEVPFLVRDEILGSDKDLTETFAKRIIKVTNDYLRGFHLRTTPEPSILNLAKNSALAHTHFPIRFSFNTESFMGVMHPVNILRGQQFNSFIGVSLDKNEEDSANSFCMYEDFAKTIFEKLKISYLTKNENKKKVEFFYETSEGDNLSSREICSKNLRGISIGMVYDYNSKNGNRIKYKDANNKNVEVHYCTFGIGIQRVLYALMDSCRDEKGFALGKFSPFDFSIIPANKNYLPDAEKLYKTIGCKALYDDRKNKNWEEKASFSDYIGVPKKIIVGREGFVVKSRNESKTNTFKNLESLVNFIG